MYKVSKIENVEELISYIEKNSSFSKTTISNFIEKLGYSLDGNGEELIELSSELESCAKNGRDIVIPGFFYIKDTIAFFIQNRRNIVSNMEQTAAELGTDIISMVQNFNIFYHGNKPTISEVGRALWDTGQQWEELQTLYSVFAWYALEEISQTWYRYLEDNPVYHKELSA